MNTNIHFVSYLAHFFLEWEMFQTKVVEKIKINILCSVTFFSKIVPFNEKMWKILYFGAYHWWQYDPCSLHARYLRLQTQTHTHTHTHTHRLFNTHCFSTATMFALTRFSVTLFVHCLSCCFYYAHCLRFKTCGISTWYLSRIFRRVYLDLLLFEMYGI